MNDYTKQSEQRSGAGSTGSTTIAETTETEIPRGSTSSASSADEFHEKKQQARERMSEAGQKIRSQAERAASGVRHRAAEEVRTFGSAINAAADKLDDKERERVGAYAHGINSTCESVADYIEHADMTEVADDAAQSARRNPAVFLGAAALAGLAIGRLLSATPPRPRHERERADHPMSPNTRNPMREPGPMDSATRTQEPRLRATTSGSVPASSKPRHTSGDPESSRTSLNRTNKESSDDNR